MEDFRNGVISLPPPTWLTLAELAHEIATADEVFERAKAAPAPQYAFAFDFCLPMNFVGRCYQLFTKHQRE